MAIWRQHDAWRLIQMVLPTIPLDSFRRTRSRTSAYKIPSSIIFILENNCAHSQFASSRSLDRCNAWLKAMGKAVTIFRRISHALILVVLFILDSSFVHLFPSPSMISPSWLYFWWSIYILFVQIFSYLSRLLFALLDRRDSLRLVNSWVNGHSFSSYIYALIIWSYNYAALTIVFAVWFPKCLVFGYRMDGIHS